MPNATTTIEPPRSNGQQPKPLGCGGGVREYVWGCGGGGGAEMHFHFVIKSSEISEFEIFNIRQYFNFRQCVILTSLIKKRLQYW